MSFPVISHLIDKNSNKGVDQVINYMNTNPLFMPHKAKIDRNPINEPSIRAYYNITTVNNTVDPTAYAQYTREKYHTQDLHFQNYNKKTLINDLESGHSNYANDYLIFNPAYKNSRKPLIRNNTILGGYMHENNTPKNVPFTPVPGTGGGAAPEPPSGGGAGPSGSAPEPPSGGGGEPSGGAGGAPAPEPGGVGPETPDESENENRKKAATKIQSKLKEHTAKKQFKKSKEAATILQSATKRFVARKKLEGIQPVKVATSTQPVEATSSSQPVEAKPEPEPVKVSTSTQPVEAKPEPADPDSPKSDKTSTEESQNMADHKKILSESYKLKDNVTKLISYTGTNKDKYAILDDIAKEFYQKAYLENKQVEYEKEFLKLITTGPPSKSGKHSLKTFATLEKVLDGVKKMKKR